MSTREALQAFLNLPELSNLGSKQERDAFIAVQIQGRTIRAVAEAIGVSKSQVTNLTAMFQDKLATRINDIHRKRMPVSKEYLEIRRCLARQLYEIQEWSGSNDDDWYRGEKIGNFSPHDVSREDWAEATGTPLPDADE